MHDTAEVTAARDALLAHFRWDGGHADVWRVFSDGPALSAAAAVSLGVGFVGIRKAEGLFPGAKVSVEAAEDYRGGAPLPSSATPARDAQSREAWMLVTRIARAPSS
jgi:hypothetical protein